MNDWFTEDDRLDLESERRGDVEMKHPPICPHPRFREYGTWIFECDFAWHSLNLLTPLQRESCQAIQHMAWWKKAYSLYPTRDEFHRKLSDIDDKARMPLSDQERSDGTDIIRQCNECHAAIKAWLNFKWENA